MTKTKAVLAILAVLGIFVSLTVYNLLSHPTVPGNVEIIDVKPERENCDDLQDRLRSWTAIRKLYQTDPEKYAYLDRDNDGYPCEAQRHQKMR